MIWFIFRISSGVLYLRIASMIAFISHNVKVADLCQFFHGFGQRRLVNTDNFRHFLGSRSGMFIKIFHIELLSPSDYPKIFAI